MKIVDKTRDGMKKFKELALEDIFRWNEQLFMKVSFYYERECSNAYNLSLGELTRLASDIEVEVIPAELILHEKGWSE